MLVLSRGYCAREVISSRLLLRCGWQMSLQLTWNVVAAVHELLVSCASKVTVGEENAVRSVVPTASVLHVCRVRESSISTSSSSVSV